TRARTVPRPGGTASEAPFPRRATMSRRSFTRDDAEFESTLLSAAKSEKGGTRGLRRTLVAMGVGSALASKIGGGASALAAANLANASGAASVGASTASKLGTFTLIKWLAVVVTAGTITVGSVHYAPRVAAMLKETPQSSHTGPVASGRGKPVSPPVHAAS